MAGLVFLPNSAASSAVRVLVTDSSDAVVSETTGIGNVTGGARYLIWNGGTADRRIVYVNKAGTLSCTHVILTRADLHLGHQLQVRSFETYSSSSTLQYSGPSPLTSASLVGRNTQDFILATSLASKEGLCMQFVGTYTKHVGKLYFSNGQAWSKVPEATMSPLPFPSVHAYRHNLYHVDERWTFTMQNLTKSDITAFEQTPDIYAEPSFLFDATGMLIPYYLLHGIVESFQVAEINNNLHEMKLSVLALRQWV